LATMRPRTFQRPRTCCPLRLAIATVLVAAATASAKKDPAAVCTAAKLQAAATDVGGLLACQSKAAKDGVPVDPACVGKATQKLADALTKAEQDGACLDEGNIGDVESALGSFVSDVVSAERVTVGASKTEAAKLTATGKLAKTYLAAYGKLAAKVDLGGLFS